MYTNFQNWSDVDQYWNYDVITTIVRKDSIEISGVKERDGKESDSHYYRENIMAVPEEVRGYPGGSIQQGCRSGTWGGNRQANILLDYAIVTVWMRGTAGM